jgi:hypothetical protein
MLDIAAGTSVSFFKILTAYYTNTWLGPLLICLSVADIATSFLKNTAVSTLTAFYKAISSNTEEDEQEEENTEKENAFATVELLTISEVLLNYYDNAPDMEYNESLLSSIASVKQITADIKQSIFKEKAVIFGSKTLAVVGNMVTGIISYLDWNIANIFTEVAKWTTIFSETISTFSDRILDLFSASPTSKKSVTISSWYCDLWDLVDHIE